MDSKYSHSHHRGQRRYYKVLLITWSCVTPSLNYADATVKLNASVYDVNEEDGSVSVCVALCDIPTGGLECAIEVSLDPADGAKAGLFTLVVQVVSLL